ncbi:hypothetical protein EBQ74_13385 [bacterium]|nr:hypothetical protein [bacterium]
MTRKNLGYLIQSLTGFVFVLLLAEGAVRIFSPQDLETYSPWYVSHPIYRLKHRSNLNKRKRWRDYYNLRTNSRGIRSDEEIPYKNPGQFRIIIHGDSIVFGNGVENSQTFAKVLESDLKLKGVSNTQVINMGVSAHGPDTEYLYYQEEGKRYSPQVGIITVYTGNDLDDLYRPQVGFYLKDNQLVFKPYRDVLKRLTENGLYLWLGDHSHLLIFTRKLLFDQNPFIRMSPQPRTQDSLNQGFALMKEIYLKFAENMKKSGTSPVFLIIPTKDVLERRLGKTLFQKRDPMVEPNSNLVYQFILDLCSKNQLNCLDTTPLFTEEVRKLTKYYIENDSHFSALGHQVIGKGLSQYLYPQMIASEKRELTTRKK